MYLSHIFKYFVAKKRLTKFLMKKTLKIIEHIIVLTTSTFPKESGITKIIKSTSESQFLLNIPTSCPK